MNFIFIKPAAENQGLKKWGRWFDSDLSAPGFKLGYFIPQFCQTFRGVEQFPAQLAFTMGYDLPGLHAGKGCNICYPHGSDQIV